MKDDIQLTVDRLSKHFVLRAQGGVRIPVLDDEWFELSRGDCLVLDGPSGAGKSTLLRCLYANYIASGGAIHVRDAASAAMIDITCTTPQTIVELRRPSPCSSAETAWHCTKQPGSSRRTRPARQVCTIAAKLPSASAPI